MSLQEGGVTPQPIHERVQQLEENLLTVVARLGQVEDVARSIAERQRALETERSQPARPAAAPQNLDVAAAVQKLAESQTNTFMALRQTVVELIQETRELRQEVSGSHGKTEAPQGEARAGDDS